MSSPPAGHGRPPMFTAYDDATPPPPPPPQPLRRRGGPVPAPASLLSATSSLTRSLHSTPVENFYASNTPTSPSSSTGGTAATSPPPHAQPSRRGGRDASYTSSAATRSTTRPSTTDTASSPTTQSTTATSTTASSSAHTSHYRPRHRDTADGSDRRSHRSGSSHTQTTRSTPSVTTAPTPLNATSSPTVAAGSANTGERTRSSKKASSAAPRSLSRRARDQASRTPTPEDRLRSRRQKSGDRGREAHPRVPAFRGPGSTPPGLRPPTTGVSAAAGLDGPLIVRASTPAAASPSSVHSFNDGSGGRGSVMRDATAGQQSAVVHPKHGSGSASSGHRGSQRSCSDATSHSSALPPHMRQETGVPSPSPAVTSPPSHSKSPSEKVVTAGPTIMSNAEREKAERDARKQLRASLYNGNIKVHGYVAQTAYAQKNPFRQQVFAEFAANPKYQPPPGFDIYSQAMATRVYGLEVSRASQGEFMMQRLVDAAHPATAEERAEMEALLSSTLEKLQVGDWFYKWTRINHVHQRYVWLNLQRGTLMWSMSPKQSVVLNAEIKLSTVTSILPDCLQLEAPMRVFYRMTINTPDRCISLATEIRKKFDVWYRVLLQLTAPNLVYGVPGVWGRPSSSVNTTGRGAASRWASRFSPLDAVMNDTTGHLGHDQFSQQGLLSSSD